MSDQKNNSSPTFQDIIKRLESFWGDKGCAVLTSFDQEVGAGTLSPYTALHAVTEDRFSVCYVQTSSRPTDTRFGEDSNRCSSYYQFQVLLKPMEEFGNIQNLFLSSLKQAGVDLSKNDIKFVEDDWKNESIGAYGLGYEVWYNGMEIAQFTYIQSIGGIECQVSSCELTYGLERIAMCLQGVSSVFDIVFTHKPNLKSSTEKGEKILYGDIHTRLMEKQRSIYNSDYENDTKYMLAQLDHDIKTGENLLEEREGLVLPAYRKCLSAGNLLNILETRGAINVEKRRDVILKIRKLSQGCVEKYITQNKR